MSLPDNHIRRPETARREIPFLTEHIDTDTATQTSDAGADESLSTSLAATAKAMHARDSPPVDRAGSVRPTLIEVT
jgi:hypothetical protein